MIDLDVEKAQPTEKLMIMMMMMEHVFLEAKMQLCNDGLGR